MAELLLSTRLAGPLVIILAVGELDLMSAPELREHLLATLCHLGPWLALDLSRVTFMDSSGLAAVVEYWRRARAAGGDLFLVGAHGVVARKLEITGLDRRLPVHPDMAAVLAALPGPSRGGLEPG